MQGGLHSVGRGTAGDDVHIRVLLDHNDVVDGLGHILALDVQAGLDRVRDDRPFLWCE